MADPKPRQDGPHLFSMLANISAMHRSFPPSLSSPSAGACACAALNRSKTARAHTARQERDMLRVQALTALAEAVTEPCRRKASVPCCGLVLGHLAPDAAP